LQLEHILAHFFGQLALAQTQLAWLFRVLDFGYFQPVLGHVVLDLLADVLDFFHGHLKAAHDLEEGLLGVDCVLDDQEHVGKEHVYRNEAN